MADTIERDIRRLDGGLLLVFRELCRTRRTTAVAVRLGLSQSAVSQALGRLRDIYGDPLFQRRPHGLEPTRRALELAPRIDALIDMLGSSLSPSLAFDATKTTRRFNVGVTEYAAGIPDGALVRAVQTGAPKSSFAVQAVRGYVALSFLRRGLIDLVVGRFDTVSPGLMREALVRDRYCVVARKGHPHIGPKLAMRAWRKAGHIFASVNSVGFDDVEGPAIGEDPMPRPEDVATVGVVPTWEIAYAMVGRSDAIATGSRRLARQMADVHRLQVIDLSQTSDWTISFARRDEQDEGLDWFCEQLKKTVAET